MRLPQVNTSINIVAGQPLVDEKLDQYIEQFYGRSLADLLAPVGETKVGKSVRHNGVYFKIKDARRSDDPTLPQGVWTHELKVADWEAVETIALDALCGKSKDLQLGVWLMESSINRYGFAGVAPAAVILRTLCETYWDTMHPQMEDGDIEFRTNPINCINQKLTLQLRLTKITQATLDGNDLCWDDWDNAQRIEKLKRQQQKPIEWNGATTDGFKQRLAATPKEYFITLCEQLDDGCRAIANLIDWFDQHCGNDSPSLSELTGLMKDIHTMVSDELKRRGVSLSDNADESSIESLSVSDKDNAESSDGDSDGSTGDSQGGGGQGGGGSGPLNNRADAYAMLRKAAEFLMRDDPHSPVPYMVHTACDWGEKLAPDLYHELFLVKGGQLNVFEIMGLEVEQK